jgi:tetratricopeptide (TPR) repeat protein
MTFKMFVLLAALAFSSCEYKEARRKEAEMLNGYAINKFRENPSDSQKIAEAIALVNQAISRDSTYIPPYLNKTRYYLCLGNMPEAIAAVGRIISLDTTQPDPIAMWGFLQDKLGDRAWADRSYADALNEYDNRLKLDTAGISLRLNRAFMSMFVNGKEKGIAEYEQIAKSHPDSVVKAMHDMFYGFDRDRFIADLCK